MQGTIKKITDKGYGFIVRDDNNEDIFFHSSDVEGTFESFNEGDKVEFDVADSEKGNGLKAVLVTKI